MKNPLTAFKSLLAKQTAIAKHDYAARGLQQLAERQGKEKYNAALQQALVRAFELPAPTPGAWPPGLIDATTSSTILSGITTTAIGTWASISTATAIAAPPLMNGHFIPIPPGRVVGLPVGCGTCRCSDGSHYLKGPGGDVVYLPTTATPGDAFALSGRTYEVSVSGVRDIGPAVMSGSGWVVPAVKKGPTLTPSQALRAKMRAVALELVAA